jgi:hypothetical protein
MGSLDSRWIMLGVLPPPDSAALDGLTEDPPRFEERSVKSKSCSDLAFYSLDRPTGALIRPQYVLTRRNRPIAKILGSKDWARAVAGVVEPDIAEAAGSGSPRPHGQDVSRYSVASLAHGIEECPRSPRVECIGGIAEASRNLPAVNPRMRRIPNTLEQNRPTPFSRNTRPWSDRFVRFASLFRDDDAARACLTRVDDEMRTALGENVFRKRHASLSGEQLGSASKHGTPGKPRELARPLDEENISTVGMPCRSKLQSKSSTLFGLDGARLRVDDDQRKRGALEQIARGFDGFEEFPLTQDTPRRERIPGSNFDGRAEPLAERTRNAGIGDDTDDSNTRGDERRGDRAVVVVEHEDPPRQRSRRFDERAGDRDGFGRRRVRVGQNSVRTQEITRIATRAQKLRNSGSPSLDHP